MVTDFLGVAMNIGQAATAAGVSAKMIRYYEAIGLLPKVTRTANGYRRYSAADVHSLRFIGRARRLGFSVAQLRRLLALWRNPRRASADVKRLAQSHLVDLQRRIDELQSMVQALQHLADHCHGDDRPDCPILDGLLAEPAPRPRSTPAKPDARRRRPPPASRMTRASKLSQRSERP